MRGNGKFTHYIKPMFATTVDKPFDGKEWIFELKLDGYRAIAEIKKRKLLLYSRNGLDLADRYPTIVAALEKISTDVILDGEIVLLDKKGKPDFQRLQNYAANTRYPIVYYVFDLLSLKKNKLLDMPLLERKKLLKKILPKSTSIRYCDHVEERGIDFFKMVKAGNFEGIIAKKADSNYYPATRTREWLKIKNHQSREAVIIGYTEPKGARQHFGSLLLAEYEKGKLTYIGHAGTGFTDKMLRELKDKMRPLITGRSPLDELIKSNGPVTWLKPVLVCEVGFSEITQDGILRHPVYKGLRTDKKSEMVEAETERAIPVKKALRSLK